MYAIRRDFDDQPAMPTGENILPPLSVFEVTKKNYQLNLHAPFGMYAVDIDLKKETGFFEHAVNGICGQFWLAGHVLVACNHLLPADVKAALRSIAIEV